MTSEQKQLFLHKYLAGERGKELAASIGASVEEIEAYRMSKPFQVQLQRASKDVVTSVTDRIKDGLFKYADKMEDLAFNATDPRVRFQALKDLLDRGGTGGTTKVALTSPAAYKKIVEEFTESEDGKEVDGAASESEPAS